MKERPILFSGPMVRSILDGRKTQTRRIFKGLTPPDCPGVHSCVVDDGVAKFHLDGALAMHSGEWTKCPYGQPGDRLWVRETFAELNGVGLKYRADKSNRNDPPSEFWDVVWKPSIFMPRWASRITLEITSVRVERLQDISLQDAIAEGVYLNENGWWTAGEMEPGKVLRGLETPQLAYGRLWEYINGVGSWLMNPWVWVITFKRIKP